MYKVEHAITFLFRSPKNFLSLVSNFSSTLTNPIFRVFISHCHFSSLIWWLPLIFFLLQKKKKFLVLLSYLIFSIQKVYFFLHTTPSKKVCNRLVFVSIFMRIIQGDIDRANHYFLLLITLIIIIMEEKIFSRSPNVKSKGRGIGVKDNGEKFFNFHVCSFGNGTNQTLIPILNFL